MRLNSLYKKILCLSILITSLPLEAVPIFYKWLKMGPKNVFVIGDAHTSGQNEVSVAIDKPFIKHFNNWLIQLGNNAGKKALILESSLLENTNVDLKKVHYGPYLHILDTIQMLSYLICVHRAPLGNLTFIPSDARAETKSIYAILNDFNALPDMNPKTVLAKMEVIKTKPFCGKKPLHATSMQDFIVEISQITEYLNKVISGTAIKSKYTRELLASYEEELNPIIKQLHEQIQKVKTASPSITKDFMLEPLIAIVEQVAKSHPKQLNCLKDIDLLTVCQIMQRVGDYSLLSVFVHEAV